MEFAYYIGIWVTIQVERKFGIQLSIFGVYVLRRCISQTFWWWPIIVVRVNRHNKVVRSHCQFVKRKG